MKITPNPTSDYVNIIGVEGEVRIIDLQGREMTRGKGRLRVAHLPAGIYYAEVRENDYIHRVQFVITK